eukprot:5589774-Prymnesium_polylepis.1
MVLLVESTATWLAPICAPLSCDRHFTGRALFVATEDELGALAAIFGLFLITIQVALGKASCKVSYSCSAILAMPLHPGIERSAFPAAGVWRRLWPMLKPRSSIALVNVVVPVLGKPATMMGLRDWAAIMADRFSPPAVLSKAKRNANRR